MAIFDPLVKALGYLLAFFYALPPHNLGVAIILVTFTIMGALYPLTAKQARSMIRMQMVQPEIKRIQAKYKNDRAQLNEEMMKFYQENKINPLAGCLPLLVQMPIFFALFRLLRNPYEYVPPSSKLFGFLCTPSGGTSPVSAKQCGDLKGLPNPTYFLSMNLSLSAPDQVETLAKILAFTLVVLVMFSGYMQSRQAQKRTPAVNKQMAMVTKVLPVFFGFISLNFPSGLVVYFFVSNLWRLGQQEVIFRRIGTAAAPKHRSLAAPTSQVVDADSRERDSAVAVDEEAPAEPEDARSHGKGGTGNGRGTTPAKGAKAAPAKGAKAAPAKGAKAGPAKGAKPPAAGKPVVGPTKAGGGLRGLFKPPPPPSGKPVTPKPAAKPSSTKKSSPSTKKSSPSAPTSRPGVAGRRSSKKKKR
jgi:YidC/Oxa1 family membrane protein insertase